MLIPTGQFNSFALRSPEDGDASGGGSQGAPGAQRQVRQGVSSEAEGSIYGKVGAAGDDAEPASDAGGEEVDGEDKDDKAPKGSKNVEKSEDEDFSDSEESAEEEGSDGEKDASDDESGEEDEDDQPGKKETVLRLDPESIRAIRGEKEQPEQKLDPAQLRKILNPVEVTDDLVAAIRSDDPEVSRKAIQDFAHATVKNAYSLASLAMDKMRREMEQSINPLIEHHQQARLSQQKAAFFKQNPDLVKFETIVKSVAREVQPNNPDGSPKTEAQIFKEVAKRSKAVLSSYNLLKQPAANHGAGSSNGQRPVPAANRMGGSGRSGGSSKPTETSPDADIYSRR